MNAQSVSKERLYMHRLTQPCWTTTLGKGFGGLEGALKPGLAEPEGGEGLSRQPVTVSNGPMLGPSPQRLRDLKEGPTRTADLAGRLPGAASECRQVRSEESQAGRGTHSDPGSS